MSHSLIESLRQEIRQQRVDLRGHRKNNTHSYGPAARRDVEAWLRRAEKLMREVQLLDDELVTLEDEVEKLRRSEEMWQKMEATRGA